MADLAPNVVVENQARQLDALRAIYELEIVGVKPVLTAGWPGPERIFRFREGVADYIIAAYCELSIEDARELLRRLEKRFYVEPRSRHVGGNSGTWLLNDGRVLSAEYSDGTFEAKLLPRGVIGERDETDLTILVGADSGSFHRAEVTCREDPRFVRRVSEWTAGKPNVTRYSLAPDGQDFIEAIILRENEDATSQRPRRGRPPKPQANRDADERLLRDWEASRLTMRSISEFARERGVSPREIRRAHNSARARRRNAAKE